MRGSSDSYLSNLSDEDGEGGKATNANTPSYAPGAASLPKGSSASGASTDYVSGLSETTTYAPGATEANKASEPVSGASSAYLGDLSALDEGQRVQQPGETASDPAPGATAEEGGDDDPSLLAEPTEELSVLKDRLLKLCLGTNRGFSSSRCSKQIKNLIKDIEALNPNPTPNDGFADGDSPLTGDWQLLYTNAPDVLSLSLLPGVTIGQIYQNISTDGTEIENIVELQPLLAPLLPPTMARLVVGAEGSVSSSVRLNLKFKSSAFTPQTLLGRKVDGLLPPFKYSFPKKMRNAGWLEHSFVDADLRIARAFGSVFILLRA